MQISHWETAPQHSTVPREGKLDNRDLMVGKEGDRRNFRLALGLAETDWLTPRHHHNFEQIRFPLEGEFQYAEGKVLPAGWVGYFPEGVHYGPQIRHKGLYMLLLQYGGASGHGFFSEHQYVSGQEALKKKGTIAKGKFSFTDKDGKEQVLDLWEAMYEEVTGKKPVYPEPRYNDIITMNPANFSWMPDRENPGVNRKQLGVFTERKTTISQIRLEKGASVEAGGCAGPDLLFVYKGALEVNCQQVPLHSAIGFEAFESTAVIRATEPSEIFRVQLET